MADQFMYDPVTQKLLFVAKLNADESVTMIYPNTQALTDYIAANGPVPSTGVAVPFTNTPASLVAFRNAVDAIPNFAAYQALTPGQQAALDFLMLKRVRALS